MKRSYTKVHPRALEWGIAGIELASKLTPHAGKTSKTEVLIIAACRVLGTELAETQTKLANALARIDQLEKLINRLDDEWHDPSGSRGSLNP